MAPPIYQMNYPPHPFWDFVQEMNQHPFWAGAQRAGPPPPPPAQPEPQHREAAQAAATEAAQTAAGKSKETSAEDPPEIDPSTLRGETCRHQRKCARRCGREQRGPSFEGGPRRGGWPAFGPPPFTMGGGPFGGPHEHRGPHSHHPHPPPFGHGMRGHGGHHHRGGPHFHRGGHRGPHHGPGPAPTESGFNLGNFLNDLGNRIGVDLTSAAQGLGVDRFMPPTSGSEADFEPKVDIFDLADQYIIHASLPGARKEDVGVDWDGEHSVLRLAGVVHRPEVDEVILQHLAVDGRKREVGVFEKAIRLGTVKEPASIDVAGIKAKMTDGVLVVRVPKVEREHHKRDVPISSATPSPPRYSHQFDHNDHETYDTVPETFQQSYPSLQPQQPYGFASRTVSVEPTPTKKVNFESEKQPEPIPEPVQSKGKSKEAEAEQEKQPEVVQETLPNYQPVQHHEQDSESDDFASDEEGEYVKINVD